MRSSLSMGGRFTLAGGREGWARLMLTAGGVTVGVGLLMLVLTALPALQGRDQRAAWHTTSATTPRTTVDRALWLASGGQFLSRELFIVQVAPLGPQPPVPPGLERLPSPGEVVVSPALRDLLDSTPKTALADRLPGTVTGELGSAGLAYPEELVAVVGRTPDQLRAAGAAEVSGISTTSSGLLDTTVIRVLLTIGAVGLLMPVVVFVATVARVSAARREQRFAALRLVGATRGQVALMAATETATGAVAGTALGWLAYLLARPIIASTTTFDGGHFMPADVSAPAAQQAIVLIGAPVLCIAATVTSLRRAQLTPLGVQRRIRTRSPGWWRLAPVAVGVVGLLAIANLDLTDSTKVGVTTAQVVIGTTTGSLLLGVVLAGPLLCSMAARLIGRFSRRLPELMAARRIAVDPYATFRAISGVAIAALVTTLLAGSAAGVEANLDRPDPDALRTNAVEIVLNGRPADALTAALEADASVRQVVVARRDPAQPGVLAVSCAELSQAINLTCPGAPSALGRLSPGLAGITRLDPSDGTLPIHALYVVTDYEPLTAERVRTLATTLVPGAGVSTGRDLVELDRRQLTELEGALRLAMLFVLLVATASLTVGVAAGLIDRRRPFALLRATGVHLGELRRMVLLETAVPLALSTVLGVGLGLLGSFALAAANGQRWAGPGPAFITTALAGLAMTLAVAAAALPLVKPVTEHDAVRFE